MIEILAPAGSKENAIVAINSGADAIYLGLTSFSARSSAKNFTKDELKWTIGYAHIHGVRVHVAMNTLVKESELDNFLTSVIEVWNLGVDAIIIQDIFLGKYIKERQPSIILHLSTQAGICNLYGAQLAKEYGFDRVILARETAFSEIAKIAKIIETEVFIQGALCTCFSGQCYMSSFAGGNSGNRGRCKQPCRKQYSINRQGFSDQTYMLSLSDLCVGEDIQKFIEEGVVSFKIEGRMRRAEYVAAAVKYYRHIVDDCLERDDLSHLRRTYNRGNYTKGLAFGQDKSFLSSAIQGHIGEYIGIVKVVNGKYVCQTKEECSEGDAFKILRDGREVAGAIFVVKTNGGIIIDSSKRLKNGDKVFITTDNSLNCTLLDSQIHLKEINISINIAVERFPEVTINGHRFVGQTLLEQAQTRSLTVDDIINCFNKVDLYPFKPKYEVIKIEGEVFLPKSLLNDLRRMAYSNYFDLLLNGKNIDILSYTPNKCRKSSNKLAVIANDLSQVNANIGILKLSDYNKFSEELIQNFNGQKYLYLPPYMTSQEIDDLSDVVRFFDGIYCDNYFAVQVCKTYNLKLFAGCGFNLANSIAINGVQAEYLVLSKELSFAEAKPFMGENFFMLSAGNIKVMDLIYCPFKKTCSKCDKLMQYSMTDENGRVFPIKRYIIGNNCRFEVYNCASLISEEQSFNALLDLSLEDNTNEIIANYKNKTLKQIYKNYTKGHLYNSVL